MKYLHLTAAVLAALLCLAACGPAQTANPLPGTTASVELELMPPEDVLKESPVKFLVPQGVVSLTDAELEWFQNDFFGGDSDTWDWGNPRPQFLTSFYDAPEEINLAELLYMGGPEAGEISQPERQELLALGFPTAVPWQKYIRSAIDAFLQEFLGLTLAETLGLGLEELTYLPAYDAYYSCRSDVNSGPVNGLDGGWRAANGTVTLVYYDRCQVVLTPQGGDVYWFHSNTRSLTAEELDWFQNCYFSGWGADALSPANAFLTCTYNAPEEMDLAELLYNGLDAGNPQRELERDSLLAAGFSAELDWQKSTASQIDALLEKYVGLRLRDMAGRGLDRLTYLPAYQAYYSCHTDTNSVLPVFLSGRWAAGGVRLVYSRYSDDDFWEVSLVSQNEVSWGIAQTDWAFASNRSLA